MKRILALSVMALCYSCSEPTGYSGMTVRTSSLYNSLFRMAKQGVMFGHQDATLYGVDWKYEPGRSDVRDVCGKYPAVYGWEIGDCELGRDKSLDGVPFTLLREHIIAAYRRGGINTISWHANNPLTGGNAWDTGVERVVASILENGSRHESFKKWLDAVADFMLSLRSDDGELIPILFRPYHEHNASWFWWGAEQSTPEEYKALWRFTVDYLRDIKGVDNLIYVYSPEYVNSEEEYLERYPGDDYVNVFGIDAYCRDAYHPGDKESFPQRVSMQLDIVTSLAAKRGKPAVFSETGSEGVPDSTWWTRVLLPVIRGAEISYVLVWRNAHDIPGHFFGPHPGGGDAEDFRKFEADPLTIFEADLNNVYR